ncbi:hypothetical protein ZHAS_00016342 [Anopheles sinensis]|uniref:Uncharacterized protein n=1 Tax=Anopheles sinensis TaxID=74873 RepID=A0A084WDC8_ANOSI|nr:hypothetical protein ZHAS_00016342 [Anopheles sinensis]
MEKTKLIPTGENERTFFHISLRSASGKEKGFGMHTPRTLGAELCSKIAIASRYNTGAREGKEIRHEKSEKSRPPFKAKTTARR